MKILTRKAVWKTSIVAGVATNIVACAHQDAASEYHAAEETTQCVGEWTV